MIPKSNRKTIAWCFVVRSWRVLQACSHLLEVRKASDSDSAVLHNIRSDVWLIPTEGIHSCICAHWQQQKKKSRNLGRGIWFECNLVRMQTRDRYVIGLMCRELHCTLWAVQMSQEAGIVQGAIKGKAVKVWKADLQKILHWFRKPV